MADKIEITEAPPQPPPPSVAESQLQMAVTFGQMTEANRQLMNEIAETKAQQSQMSSTMAEALSEIRALRSQTDSTSRHAEQLNESLTDIILTDKTNSEKEDSQVIPVTPPMETHIQIDQKPVNRPNLLQRIFF